MFLQKQKKNTNGCQRKYERHVGNIWWNGFDVVIGLRDIK